MRLACLLALVGAAVCRSPRAVPEVRLVDDATAPTLTQGGTLDPVCAKEIQNIVSQLSNATFFRSNASFWLKESGNGINDMGHMVTCNDYGNGSTAYSVIRTKRRDLLYKFSFGYCGPIQCDVGQLNIALSSPQFADGVVQLQTQVAKGSGYTPQDYAFEFYSPTTLSLGVGGWFVIIIFGLLALPSLLSCITYIFSEKRVKRDPTKPIVKEVAAKKKEKDPPEDPAIKYTVRGLLDIFNAKKNTNILFDTRTLPDQPYIRAIDGVKFFLMAGTVAVSNYLTRFGFSMNFGDKDFWGTQVGSKSFQMAMIGYYLSDAYLFLGGVVAAIYISGVYQRNPNPQKGLIRAIIYKIFRVYPMYIFAVLFYYKVLPAFTTGPSAHLIQEYTNNCSNWWADLLMIGSWIYPNKQCLEPTWYLQVDFHLFFVLLLGFFVAQKIRGGGFIVQSLASVFALLSLIIGVIVFLHKKLMIASPVATPAQINDYTTAFLHSDISRSFSYFLGAIFGVYFFATETKRRKFEESHPEMNSIALDSGVGSTIDAPRVKVVDRFKLLEGYIVPTCGLLGVVGIWIGIGQYLNSGDSWAIGTRVIWNFGSRLGLCLCLLTFLVPELTRSKYSVFRFILSAQIWTQFARVGLSFFVLYLVWIQYQVAVAVNSQYYDHVFIANYCLADFYFILIPTFLLSALYEQPGKKLGWLIARLSLGKEKTA